MKHLMSDRILRKRLIVAKLNDQSMFDENGELCVIEDDSIEEHNFFEVKASIGTALIYEENPPIFVKIKGSSQTGF